MCTGTKLPPKSGTGKWKRNHSLSLSAGENGDSSVHTLESADIEVSGKSEPLRVLIADDSQAFYERLAELLEPLPEVEIRGHTTDVRGTLRRVAESQPDVVILDLHMPGGNGIDALKRIKRTEPGTIVMVLTNFAFPQHREQCMDLGADYFLDKSTEFEKVPGLLVELAKKPRSSSKTPPGGLDPEVARASASKAPRRTAPGSTDD
jgi:DNA-binding NarL/FixJ family response regulator